MPLVAARAWILMDQPSGQTLASGNPDIQLAPASLTKIMTAYLLFTDLHNKKLALGGTLSVPASALKSEGASIFLTQGESVNVGVLLEGMLVQSATDATLTLVTAVAPTEAESDHELTILLQFPDWFQTI